jgi:hypothetical protein
MGRGARNQAVAGLLYGERRRRVQPPRALPPERMQPEWAPLVELLEPDECLKLLAKHEPDGQWQFPQGFTKHRVLWYDWMRKPIEHGWYRGQRTPWAVVVGRRRKRIKGSGKPPNCKYDDRVTFAAMEFRHDGPVIQQIHHRYERDDLAAAIREAAQNTFEDKNGYKGDAWELRPLIREMSWTVAKRLRIARPTCESWEKLEEFDAIAARL